MIEARELTKRYGSKTAVDGVSFTVEPGRVTGFLGPNGAGKSTTMRMIVGLDRPTSGSVTVNGKFYHQHAKPLAEVGVLLDAKAVHTSRTAYNHLRAQAATHGIPTKRVQEVIELTGLQPVAKKRVGGFSLGMGQRLGIAAALLGDPRTLILDEPVNGLDPEGVKWIRDMVRFLASEGRTILLSSHLMSEMAQTADHILVIGRGRIIASAPVGDFINGAKQTVVRLRSPRLAELGELLQREGGAITPTPTDRELVEVNALSAQQIGDLAAAAGIPLYELTPVQASLEEAYMELTKNEVEYRSGEGSQIGGEAR